MRTIEGGIAWQLGKRYSINVDTAIDSTENSFLPSTTTEKNDYVDANSETKRWADRIDNPLISRLGRVL